MQQPQSVLAFDVGGTSTKLALVSSTGEIRAWTCFPTQSSDKDVYLAHLTAALRKLARDASAYPVGIAGAIAGFLSDSGTLVYNPNLPWLEGADFRATLLRHFELPVHLEADANAACAGEYMFGSGRGSSRFLCVSGGTGLGAGMIVDGQIVRCTHGGLGDAGHIILRPNGPPCTCGGRGCAEAILSTTALAREHSKTTGQHCSFRNLASAAQARDPLALATLEHAGYSLGIFLASLAQILLPDTIAVAGGLSALGEPFLESARVSFLSHAGTVPGSLTSIVCANAGAQAALQGAAASLLLSDRDRTFRLNP